MITAMISTILGMLGGVLPDLMKLLADKQSAKNERMLLELQARNQLELAKYQKDTRLAEISNNEVLDFMRAQTDSLRTAIEVGARTTGIAWIDAFNAMLRPFCTVAIILLFLVTAAPFVWVVVHQMAEGTLSPEQTAKAIFGSLVGEAITAVIAFLYGYRSTAKK